MESALNDMRQHTLKRARRSSITFRTRFLAAGTVLMVSAGVSIAAPVITSINSDNLPRSGRVSIAGTGFGTEGQVLVSGMPAWVSTWGPDRIVAYVPEQVPIGQSSVIVDAEGQQSNPVPVTVTLRQREGRIRWSFEIDQDQIFYRPAVAPDGTIYIHGRSWEGGGEGRVYALSPDGALLWINRDTSFGPYVPPAAGPDGAVYVGSINWLYRISPSGQLDWSFQGATIQSGAAVGPDGTVYAGFELDPEIVALDPADGSLIWSNSPGLSAFGTGGTEGILARSTAGGPIDRFYTWWDALAAFTLDGDHLFTTSLGNIYSHEVGVGSDGTLYAPANFESELAAASPFDGNVYWLASSPWLAGTSDVEVGPDDTLYFVSDGRWIDAFDPHTRSSIWRHRIEFWLDRPTLSPDGTTLLTSGGGWCDSSGCRISFVKAFDTTDGQELWNLDLNDVWDPEYRNVTGDRARISADGSVAYFVGYIAGSFDAGDERSLLWAIDLDDPPMFSDGLESGDTSAWTQTTSP
ncbi:MAG: PQQ-binding-like beta-propeller repeat protein, partial [Candidatus Sulfomarinibacteraceae bacterium]